MATETNLIDILHEQKEHFKTHCNTSYQQRIKQLKSLKLALLEQQAELLNAISTDYGYRSRDEGLLSDIMPVINQINYTIKQLHKWMKPSHRHSGLVLMPAKVHVQYQPIGVIGIIVPWNFPIMLSLSPLISVISAGNNAMLKLSEYTPATNQVLKQLLHSVFSENQVSVIEGNAAIGAAFSELAFDHLIFTGSTSVGKKVMAAAAKNLTPVTLELGGKSPVIIANDIPIDIAVQRMIYGKTLNAGQICIAPDYVLCPHNQIDEFIESYKIQFTRLYGKVNNNPDYSNIINQSQFERLLNFINDAKEKGAQVISASNEEINESNRKLPTQLVINANNNMLVMQQEIFGPLLPIIPYQSLDEAINFVNERPRPLALYLMSFDKNIQQKILTSTHSGGVCINETIKHVAIDDAPFGGIGLSGIGHYHSKEGFLRFSHAKTVLTQGKINLSKLMLPPYGKGIHKLFFKYFLR